MARAPWPRRLTRLGVLVAALASSCCAAPPRSLQGPATVAPNPSSPAPPREVPQRRHAAAVAVVGLSLSADGALITSVDASGEVVVQRRRSGRVVARASGCRHDGRPPRVFGGDRFLHCGDTFWDLSTGRSAQLEMPPGWAKPHVEVSAYRPATAQVVIAGADALLLVDIAELAPRMTDATPRLPLPGSSVRIQLSREPIVSAATFDESGRWLAIMQVDRLVIWDAHTRAERSSTELSESSTHTFYHSRLGGLAFANDRVRWVSGDPFDRTDHWFSIQSLDPARGTLLAPVRTRDLCLARGWSEAPVHLLADGFACPEPDPCVEISASSTKPDPECTARRRLRAFAFGASAPSWSVGWERDGLPRHLAEVSRVTGGLVTDGRGDAVYVDATGEAQVALRDP